MEILSSEEKTQRMQKIRKALQEGEIIKKAQKWAYKSIIKGFNKILRRYKNEYNFNWKKESSHQIP